jgi:hypothetical protein
MNVTIEDLRNTTIPKSTQLNADQLVVGPMNLTITAVKQGPDEKQPISVHYENEAGRPFLPCLTMRRVLLAAWGIDGHEWVGKSLRVFHDPQVRFGGEDVGGVRISHMTDIPGKRIELKLTASKGKKVLYTIERMEPQQSGPTIEHVLQLIVLAANNADMKAAKAAAKTLTSEADVATALEAYKARVAELSAKAATAKPEATADNKTLDQFKEDIDGADNAEAAQAILDLARNVLNAADQADLQLAFDMAWTEQ